MTINDYEPIVGPQVIEELRLLGRKLAGVRILNINSTAVGGGVAEILNRMIPLAKELGVDTAWHCITGGEQFFRVTKMFHNALHGQPEKITEEDLDIFIQTNERNMEEMDLDADALFIHDPQPILLARKRHQIGRKWVWRCHIDVSNPDPKVWDFLRPALNDYDAAVFSASRFSQPLPIRQFLMSPSIDPLSEKNRELLPEEIDDVLARYDIRPDGPIITQVSRFDRLKDPVGVVEAFEIVHKRQDCQLILAGGTADDDPESDEVYAEVMERAAANPDIHVLLLPPGSDLEVNALQRASTVIVQKSIREGFGLTVSEALWKGKPVVASAVGGIPLQIRQGYSGLLCHSVEGAAHDIRKLLNNPDYAARLGANGREHVRENFLFTRHLREVMLVFLAVCREEERDIVYLF